MTTPAALEIPDDYRWRLVEPFEFRPTDSPDDVIHDLARNVTDQASIPRLLWSVFPPHGRCAKAAIIHDWMYENGLRTKRAAPDRYRSLRGCSAEGETATDVAAVSIPG